VRLLVGGVVAVLVASFAPRAATGDGPGAETCGGTRLVFQLEDVKGKLYSGLGAVTRKPVAIAYYSGYKTQDVHENVRQAVKNDPVVGEGKPGAKLWDGFAIVDYKEGWFVPGWAIDRAIKKKMAKYPDAIFLADRGECLTKSGTSKDCPGRTRRSVFASYKGYILLTYKGAILKKIEGAYDPKVFVKLLRQVTELASKGLGFCEVKRALGL
jgi:hypothetical protein